MTMQWSGARRRQRVCCVPRAPLTATLALFDQDRATMANALIDEAAFRNFERSRHDDLADSYHQFFAPITALASHALLDAACVGPGTMVLDVATGSGAVARAANQRGAAVFGVDLSPKMVALAQSLHSMIEFHQADVEHLPFSDVTFDAIVCNFGLGHFPDAQRAMRECVRVVRSGGYLAVSWWDVPARQRLQGMFIEALQEAGAKPPPDVPPGPPMFRYSEDDALRELLQSVGLNAVSVSQYHRHHEVSDVESLWRGSLGSLARTSSVVLGQPPQVQQRIREIFDRLASAYAEGGLLRIPISFKVASGKRG